VNDEQTGPVFHHPVLGYRTRTGDWPAQQRATYDLCLDALADERWDDAIALVEHTVLEAREPHELYRDWADGIRDYMLAEGVPATVIAADEEALLETLVLDDGKPFDADDGWAQTTAHAANAVRACERHDADFAAMELERSRRVWQATHDRKCDWVQGMVAIAAKHLGEDCVGPLWDRLMAPIFANYEKYDCDRRAWAESAELILRVTVDSLRGHLTGAHRRGEIEYVEEPGRRGFRFTPCGAGGRNFTADGGRGFPLTQAEHDWAWNRKGVCLYCVHCCAVSERNPIRRYGYPARVIEPPYENETGRRDFCTWWVYDDPHDVPAEVYRRTGNTKPDEIGGNATRRRNAARDPDAAA